MNDETQITIDPARAGRLLRWATYASVATAMILIAGKLAAALMTGSVSVLASLVDSMMDAAASIINLLAVHYALQPPDHDHRFGHGKAEPLAGLVQAAFITGSAVFLILHAVDRLVHPQPLNAGLVGVGVLVFSMVATGVLLLFQHYVIRLTQSTAIRADALHYATDLLTNGATIMALGLAMLGWPIVDPIFAIGIALYILYSAGQIGHESVQLLMDRELPPEVHARIKEIVRGHPLVRGVHDVRTRKSGPTYFIQLHLMLDDQMPLVDAHRVTDEVETAILNVFPNADVLIHEDPASEAPPEPLPG
ncbi:MAG TPA: cation diffusion facilitator family transporter [Candidatus Competibacteraceae bacterium]|nr:cation diffusion facilitator family transporter [Candidatus Competibacteraceae bacterium]HRZ05214.1 cation diffusion facilitator family transporter [Candidatus Competibacteraceae bacterium]HSA46573.1 cation diffusion facilitator family transporter [Candidatus Competibacteraceae bacterium]